MRIKKFKGIKVNGYLNFNLTFFAGLTFITGINGSGKTTVLNSIVSLIMPRLDFLATNEYEMISVTLHDGSGDIEITATRDMESTRLTCSSLPDEEFVLPEFAADPDVPPSRQMEYEHEFYREMISRNAKNPVLRKILDLSTPMYLNLDRRLVSADHMPVHISPSRYQRRPRSRIKRNVFSRSLGQSLNEAIGFVEAVYRENAIKKNRLDEQFRRDIIVALIDFPPISIGQLEMPTLAEQKGLQKAKENLERLPELLRVPASSIGEKLDPLFVFLDERADQLKPQINKKEELPEPGDPDFDALVDWSFNKTHLKKINIISEKISKYNAEVEKINLSIDLFLDSINSFFADSRKTVRFDEHGELFFRRSEEQDERALRTLSSGEIQLFVILTHLHFNPEAKRAGVFIIDEPELSLHVQWQEKFVAGIQSAAEDIQLILATHSPSIILEKTNRCRDISS